MEKHLNVPANTEELAELKSGDYVYLTGTIYTARDAAHKRMYETLLDGGERFKEFTAFLPGLLFINTMNELYKI